MIYAVLFLLASMTYFIFGNFTLSKNSKNTNNRMYFLIAFLFAFWSLINAVLYLVTDPEIAAIMRKVSVISWGTILSFILHLTLRLSGLDRFFNKKYKKIGMYIFLYFPAVANIYLYFFNTYGMSGLDYTKSGWIVDLNIVGEFFWDYFFLFSYLLFMILIVMLTIIWNIKAKNLREKTYSKYLLIAYLFPFVFGSLFEIILPLNGIRIINGTTLFFSIVPVILIYYIIKRFGFLSYGSNKFDSQIMKLTSEGVIICNLMGEIESINEGALNLLGYLDSKELYSVRQIGLDIEGYSPARSKENTFICKDGTKSSVLVSSKEIYDDFEELYAYILVFQDMSELRESQNVLNELNFDLEKAIEERTKDLLDEIKSRKNAEKEIYKIAYKDFLTGLYNRRYYEQALTNLDKEEYYPISLVMADINGLKLINDAFGHKAGDTLLIKAASTIQKACRKTDVLSRIGGDEFVIIMPKTTGKEADEVISKIHEESKKVVVNSIKLSISFGYRTKTNKAENIQEVFRNAEDLMYREKLLKIPSMRSSAIEAILKTLYEKDEDSEIHSRSVALYSEKIAKACGMERQHISEVKTAGLLHDIGKILISKNTLTKKGILTDDEFTEMKNHPEIGFRVLNSSHQMRGISNIVLHHHERWDGKGYPMKVKGYGIPLTSRIISIADSYDAMTNKRTYKETMSKEEALQEIIDKSGTQFDPDLVEIFSDNFEDIINIDTE